MELAGAWNDMSDEYFKDFLDIVHDANKNMFNQNPFVNF